MKWSCGILRLEAVWGCFISDRQQRFLPLYLWIWLELHLAGEKDEVVMSSLKQVSATRILS